MVLSIKLKISLITICIITFMSLVILGYTYYEFKLEIINLNELDYAERIRSLEYEYNKLEVDDVAGASENLDLVKDEVIKELEQKYGKIEGLSSYPVIFNGDQDVIFRSEKVTIPSDFFNSDNIQYIIQEKNGSYVYDNGNDVLWAKFSYYKEWDWYTVFIIEDSKRFIAVNSLIISLIIMVTLIGVLMSILIYLYLHKNLSPLKKIVTTATEVTDGNLTVKIPVKKEDEFGIIAMRFNDVISTLIKLISSLNILQKQNSLIEDKVINNTKESVNCIGMILSDSDAIGKNVDKLQSQVDISMEAADSITATIKNLDRSVATHISEVEKSAADIKNIINSVSSVQKVTENKIKINDNLNSLVNDGVDSLFQTNTAITSVSDKINIIKEFVKIIENLAEQTSLLSMNAAIEAANAGEAGKGFTVVAGEIRKLATTTAENSENISKSINEMIGTIEEAHNLGQRTDEIFSSISYGIKDVSISLSEIGESSNKTVSEAVHLTEGITRLNETVMEIKDNSTLTSQNISHIDQALIELSNISKETITSINNIKRQTNVSSEMMKHMESDTKEMSNKFSILTELISKFKINSI